MATYTLKQPEKNRGPSERDWWRQPGTCRTSATGGCRPGWRWANAYATNGEPCSSTLPNSVWSYDFVRDQLVDGRALKMLCVIDEYTRECLAIEAGASLRSQDVILTLSRLVRLYASSLSFGLTTALIYRYPGHALAVRRCNRASLRRLVAKRIPREHQRQAAWRIAEPRMVPQPLRSGGALRTLEAVLQRAPAPQLASLSTSRYGSSSRAGVRQCRHKIHHLIGQKTVAGQTRLRADLQQLSRLRIA
ncbi:hypothetical protein BDI4_580015 [Burkholderia diffusa]|nr:hypothetical protein BDI4_580015 [Burkholderia diffusa]